MKLATKSVVLVYSGGLDTTVCVPILRRDYGYEKIITVTVDVGQPRPDMKEAAWRAKKLGASHVVAQAREEFAKDYIFPSLHANGSYYGYPLSTAIARPLIAKKAVEAAKKFKASAIAHGCTGRGNDQFRIEYMISALAPEIKIIAPVRDKNLTRDEEIEIVLREKLPYNVKKKKKYSIDENLWGRSIEGGLLEDPSVSPPDEIYQWTKVKKIKPADVTVSFEKGNPAALDGKKMNAVMLIEKMNALAGSFGIGRINMTENRVLGQKSRENYECPAAVALTEAHKALEALVLPPRAQKIKAVMELEWAELAYQGLWMDPAKSAIEAFIQKTQEHVTGKVKLKLSAFSARVLSVESPYSLLSEELASFDEKSFDQKTAEGALFFHGISSKLYYKTGLKGSRAQGVKRK